MSKIALSGNPSGTGTFTIASPNSNTDRTLTLPDATGTVALTSQIPAAPTIASTAEAQAGTNNTNFMTPLRTAQQRDATALGWGQTWQNVTGSRSNNVTYTNSTGRPIQVLVVANYSADSNFRDYTVTINGVQQVAYQMRSNITGNFGMPTSFVVPNGQTYCVSFFTGIWSWAELR